MKSLDPLPGKTRMRVRLSPGARKDSVRIDPDGRIKVSVTSLPIEGKANKHLVKLLSKKLKIAKSSVTLDQGPTSKDKTLLIEGLTAVQIITRLTL